MVTVLLTGRYFSGQWRSNIPVNVFRYLTLLSYHYYLSHHPFSRLLEVYYQTNKYRVKKKRQYW